MRTSLFALALVGALVGGISAASAQSRQMMQHDHGMMMGSGMRGSSTMERTMERRAMPMREPRTTGTVRPGASAYAPGQLKRNSGETSARRFAPGQRMQEMRR